MYENELPLPSLPSSGLTTLNNRKNLKIQVEKRKVKLDDTNTPNQENTWIYRSVSSPSAPGTTVRGNYLGPIINVTKGTGCNVTWINTLDAMLGMPEMQETPPINPPPMNTAMQPSVGITTHLHGAKVQPQYDGWPLAPVSYVGNPYGFPNKLKFTYPNQQRAAMLWFHDHSMDNTAPQVHAGLAGLYFIRDQSDIDIAALIGSPDHEIPLVIQDRNITCSYDGIDYWAGLPSDKTNPNLSPDGYFRPEFLGETIFVNGRATPFHNVDRSIYRLRILNGSNARTYALALIDPFWWAKQGGTSKIWYSDRMRVIGNDGGLLTQSTVLNSTDYLLIAPGERLDILLDLTGVASNIDCLRLVNLAIASALDTTAGGLEGIFQSDSLSVLTPINDTDSSLNNALKLGQANIMQFCLSQQAAGAALAVSSLNNILINNATDDNFALNGSVLGTIPPTATIARNRFVLLMNDTGAGTPHPMADISWSDVQMWELGAANGTSDWNLPFDVDVTGINPSVGNPTVTKTYGVYRSTFFQQTPAPIITPAGYPALHTPTITPKAGTYERWYVANIGNAQLPASTDVVDMHPFHIHLVNFTVLRRWNLNGSTFQLNSSGNPLEFDGKSRHDTVRIQSNELLELLVYFPSGFTGNYVYHCHLVEHEDMGMMLHFNVQP